MKGKNYKLTVAHTMMVEEKMNKKINDLRIQHCKSLVAALVFSRTYNVGLNLYNVGLNL